MINSRAKWMGGGAAVVIAIASVMGSYFEGTRHVAYPDPASLGPPWTICKGHTKGVKPDDTADDAQCAAWLRDDMADAYAAVQRCITADLTIPQAAAFTDAVFNAGPQVVCGSTLQKLANAGDLADACEQLLRWNKAGGVVMLGLVKRRQAERDLCINGLP